MAAERIIGVLFDWDGVLLDSLGAACNVYNKIFAKRGMRTITRDEYLELQSPNWYEFYTKVRLPESQWDEVDREWLLVYAEERPGLHSDALRCLVALKEAGLKMALVSNGSEARVEAEVAKFGLGWFFDAVLFGVKREELKPSPAMIQKALVALAVGPGDAVYVGDSPADVQAAKNARVRSIAIARGRIEAERLAREEPDRLFAGLDEAANFVLETRAPPGGVGRITES